MYDMYPEWGPARSDEDNSAPFANRAGANWTGANRAGASWTGAEQESIDRRDGGGERTKDS